MNGRSTERWFLGREAISVIVVLWIIQFAMTSIRQNMSSGEAPGFDAALSRAIVSVGGMLLFYVIGVALMTKRQVGVAARVALAFPLAILGATGHAVLNELVFFYVMAPDQKSRAWDAFTLYTNAHYWFWGYLAWAVIAVAFAYNRQLRARDRLLAETEALAHRAQLRALRYQVNPHFLFNTLNAVSALVGARDLERAETMIANLSDFMRTSLTTDPLEDISLRAELAYERLYLDIEQVRFPDRLKVTMDLPEELHGALVPSLILQPVVENAIKHGVARSAGPVTIDIAASVAGASLELVVADDAVANGVGPAPGAGVGLANVRQRLATRFGPQAALDHEPRPEGGHRVRLRLPLRYAEHRQGESE